MIRLTLLGLFIAFVSLYSFKDWYKSLCALIVFVSIIEHPDVPKSIMGIQGLSPWNILFFFVLLGFLFRKRSLDTNNWKFPGNTKPLLIIYLVFCLLAFIRMSVDLEGMVEWTYLMGLDLPSFTSLFAEHVINVFKWVVPGLLLFYGCNSQKRFIWGLSAALFIYIILSLLTIKAMPIGALTDADRLEYLARKLLSDNVGYHRVNLAMMFSGAFWAIYALTEYPEKNIRNLYIYAACAIVLFALALSGGRTGYATWAGIGFIFAIIKWRKFLIYGPIAVVLVILILPAARDRLLTGFSESTADSRSGALLEEGLINENSKYDFYTVTSGRTIAWPFVLEKIAQRPFFGYGKEAMIREGVSHYLWTNFNESFPHPHNMYLQWLFDNGIIAFIPVMMFYIGLLIYSYSLLKDKRNNTFFVAGAAGIALIMALFVAGIGSQTFYPREGAVGMWCVIGLLLRVYMQRRKYDKEHKDDNELSSKSISNEALWKSEVKYEVEDVIAPKAKYF